MPNDLWPINAKFHYGDRVKKHSGSWWLGRVVGWYSTEQTPIGYCVQLETVLKGPVQIYPEAALEYVPAQHWEIAAALKRENGNV